MGFKYLAACIAIEQLRDVGLDVRLLQGARKALWVYAYWKGRHPRQGAIVFHTFRCSLQALL